MSEENLNVGIILDTTAAHQQLAAVEAQASQVNQEVNTLSTNARETIRVTVGLMRSTYGMLRGALRAAGVTVDAITNAVVSATIQLGEQFLLIATAEAVTPGMKAAAVITAIQAGIIIASAVQMEKEKKERQRSIEATNLIINNVNSFVGWLNY